MRYKIAIPTVLLFVAGIVLWQLRTSDGETSRPSRKKMEKSEKSFDISSRKRDSKTNGEEKSSDTHRYLGGMKNLSCLPGMRVLFHATFSGTPESVTYIVGGEEIDGEKYPCETPGEYEISAIAKWDDGTIVQSDRFTLTVEEMPEELERFQGAERVRY